jgi:hypothetical protein
VMGWWLRDELGEPVAGEQRGGLVVHLFVHDLAFIEAE